jgi:lipid II:glycine glycyltransferase (peptidoglycan interpeptide bridge formation enzyme)
MRISPVDLEATRGEGSVEPPSSFLQTPFWASFKSHHGWKSLYFEVAGLPERPLFFLTVLVRPLTRFASVVYVPLGPDVEITDVSRQAAVLDSLAKLLREYIPSNALCIRFDPPWGVVTKNDISSEREETVQQSAFPEIPGKPVRRAPSNVQPPDTVWLDLTRNEDELLSGMKAKWRYNIKLGEKKGVTVRFLSGDEGLRVGIDAFYRLYLETASRDGIAIHSREYYGDLITHAERLSASGDLSRFDKPISVRVYLAEHEGETLASIITLFCGEEAIYLYGASSNNKRNLMPAYSLQWQAIRDAREAGCTRYDFYGIPPEDDPSHPMYGLYRFKTGFGGFIVHRVGSLDVACKPILYCLYRLAEAARAFWFKKAVKAFRRETPRKS